MLYFNISTTRFILRNVVCIMYYTKYDVVATEFQIIASNDERYLEVF